MLILMPLIGLAMFVHGEKVPIDRLITNVKAHFSEYTDQAEAHYLLGRLESLAFSQKVDFVEVRNRGRAQPPYIAFGHEPNPLLRSDLPLTPKTKQLFASSLEHYRQAITLDPKQPLYNFSFGWMADQAEHLASRGGPLPSTLSWRRIAIQEYQKAWELSRLTTTRLDPGPVVAVDAAQALIVDLEAEIKLAPSSLEDRTLLSEVRADVNRLNKLPRAITPLIFSLRPNAHLKDLLSTQTVPFDLDGFNEHHAWPWLQSDTAILVWDPDHEGRIRSGRQIFGSVTWWMFWKNGFEPLAALDDNGDGQLTGRELDGIGVWVDRNGNGISDPGEVTPASEFGIAALAVHPEGNFDGVLANCTGVTLRDGRTPTLFDWVPRTSR